MSIFLSAHVAAVVAELLTLTPQGEATPRGEAIAMPALAAEAEAASD